MIPKNIHKIFIPPKNINFSENPEKYWQFKILNPPPPKKKKKWFEPMYVWKCLSTPPPPPTLGLIPVIFFNFDFQEKKTCFDLLAPLRSRGCMPRHNFCLYVVVYFIPFNLICNMTIFWGKKKDFNRVRCQGHSDPKILNATLCDLITHTYTHTHSKFGIPTSNNIGNILRTRLF